MIHALSRLCPGRRPLAGALALLLTAATGAALDLTSATIPELNAALAAGRLTSEQLTTLYLRRIAAYDKQGPEINAVITLNLDALAAARALDAERRSRGPRGPLHGIPVVLKDNYDTVDLPTTAGCQMLEGSVPPDDACLVHRLRAAGAVILAKVNLSELASDGGAASGYSSLGGQTRNPHDPTRAPAGSSGGTGAAVAAAFAQLGLGTDTSSSVRAPCSVNGLAGLRPTLGLLSRDGIVPLSLSFDTGGPMARSVTDLAVVLGVLAGVDPADPATAASAGRGEADYTAHLRRGALRGARLGVAREFFGRDPGTDRVMELAIVRLRELGATVVDPVRLPAYALAARAGVYKTIRSAEFPGQLDAYLATLRPGYPRTLAELIARAEDPAAAYRSPWKLRSLKGGVATIALDDPEYRTAQHEGRALVRAALEGVFARDRLDAILYPTLPRPAAKIDAPEAGGTDESALHLAPVAGFPDLVVPAGMTHDGLPVTISFLGLPYTEGRLLGLGYDFEQATQARRLPRFTPRLAGEEIADR
ncbi:MAG: glutamyl-tRNA amidotransferase [Opitutaceae bacterium]|nr:glutamyl-tRNA amidotransferase [Opitutaceae bacterium]